MFLRGRAALSETQPRAIEGVTPIGEFSAFLRRERDRADRTLDVLSLVVLEVPEDALANPWWRRKLGRTFLRRLRSTDGVGWLDANRIGVALPHTPESGAWSLVHHMREALGSSGPELEFRVHSHRGSGGGKARARRGKDGDDEGGPGATSVAEVAASDAAVNVESFQGSQGMDAFLLDPPGLVKRCFDLVLGSLALLVFSPVLALAAIAIKCDSRGPVLFRQKRAGYGGRPFVMYKLRTMVDGADDFKGDLAHRNEADGPVFKMRKDPRVTPVGRFLRKTSIDELPQLWNVLRGEMSLVGPRPPTLDEIEHYSSWQRRRLHGMCGLTCLWQVNGRSNISFLDWMRLDIRYLRSRSLVLDLVLLLKTIPAVLLGKGAR